jgi:hypothetical protein
LATDAGLAKRANGPPNRFDPVAMARAAQALGVAIPRVLWLRPDEVIE